jgi:hypothetical protein
MALNFIQQFQAARNASTPLVAVRTVDATTTMSAVAGSLNGERPALMVWDVVHGMRGLNDHGQQAIRELFGDTSPLDLREAKDTLGILDKTDEKNKLLVPEGSIIFMLNMQNYLKGHDEAEVIQGVWNLRDPFKGSNVMLVMLLSSGETLPASLVEDVTVLDQPLPTEEELLRIIDDGYSSYADALKAKKKAVPKIDRAKCADALAGLGPFAAEQNFSMCLDMEGGPILMDEMWERKRKTIEQTPGLSIYRGKETFADLGGLKNIKQYFTALLKGTAPPRGIVWIDEIQDAMSGVGSAVDVVKGDMHGMLLKWMQDKQITGAILTGAAGSGKSAISKALANEAHVPCIEFKFSEMQGSLVGQSEARLRAALNVVDAMTQDRVIVMATCNSMAGLTPQLVSRFKEGIWFFDLPDEEEAAPIWAIHRKAYKLDSKDPLPPKCKGWTGREIEACCYKSATLRKPLKEVAQYIVPTCESGREQLAESRQRAAGRYLSASHPGLYTPPAGIAQAPRKFGGPVTVDQKGGEA